jgi:hypothetical protein
MDSLILLVEKNDVTVRARTCANGSTQSSYISNDEAESPTVMSKSKLMTATIDAKEGRDVMTAYIPHAFVQTKVGPTANTERVIMKIKGPLVDTLILLNNDLYQNLVFYENGIKVLYVEVLKAFMEAYRIIVVLYKTAKGFRKYWI